MKKHKGIGLYSYEQSKAMTPFLYFGVILVGGIFLFLGTFALWSMLEMRDAEPGITAFAQPVAMIILGLFFSHTGIIYYFRRTSRWLKYARHQRTRRTRKLES